MEELSQSIVSGEVPGKLKSPHIIRRSNCIRSQIGKEQAELIKEHLFAGRRWAVNVCQHNITRFETNVHQLELERCVRKVEVSR